jgi:hypothetical protein
MTEEYRVLNYQKYNIKKRPYIFLFTKIIRSFPMFRLRNNQKLLVANVATFVQVLNNKRNQFFFTDVFFLIHFWTVLNISPSVNF